ncbi:DUF3363 domain-containing protein [Hellea balneolensis]|uniref:DUF3363 domain-containing protein n=1 Tax=Hellea balneolensis TaxID=287478 RepID=UPI000424874A|nr:DUF3363 domain-containing protein [Hellea balneolensis]
MSQDRDNDFRVQMGRRKASRERRVRPKRPQSFLDSLTPRKGSRSSRYRSRPSQTVQRSFHRRVIVQASIKRMSGTGAAKLKDHLSYLERDATQKDASPGKLYGSLLHDVDAESFRDRCKGDRHHFRFVVSPEDAEQMADLKSYTRELVSCMESDLGTKLDWVAVDHYDTAQPHTHLLVRGVRDDGKDLVIPRDYISRGMRERAQEIASLELGPQSELEKRAKLARAIEAQHKTDLDKMIDRAREGETLDLRKPVRPNQLWRKQLMARRIKTLQQMGLAEYEGRGQWTIKPDFTQTLTKMGEQNDIIKTLHRAFGERSAEIRLGADAIFDPAAPNALSQAGIVKRFGRQDDTRESSFVVIETLRGKPLYAKVEEDEVFSSLKVGQAVTVQAFDPEPIQADRNIVAHAERHEGVFSPVHVHLVENNSEEYTRAHERRLEALGRANVVSKNKSGAWDIPDDYLDRVRDYHEQLAKRLPAPLVRDSVLTIKQMTTARGATWLDEQLKRGSLEEERTSRELLDAAAQRRAALRQMGFGIRDKDRLLQICINELKDMDVKEAGNALENQMGKPYASSSGASHIEGVFKGTIERPSGKFAVIEKSREFTLVPWRPIMERRRGLSIIGRASQGGGISWDVRDRQRDRGLSL